VFDDLLLIIVFC